MVKLKLSHSHWKPAQENDLHCRNNDNAALWMVIIKNGKMGIENILDHYYHNGCLVACLLMGPFSIFIKIDSIQWKNNIKSHMAGLS